MPRVKAMKGERELRVNDNVLWRGESWSVRTIGAAFNTNGGVVGLINLNRISDHEPATVDAETARKEGMTISA